MAGREKKTIAENDADFAAAESEERLPAPVESDESQYVVASAKSIPDPEPLWHLHQKVRLGM